MNDTTTYQSSIGQLIEPDPIGYSFMTTGWFIVLGILLVTGILLAILQYRKYKKNTYRREALKQIETILQTKKETVVFEINRLLKIIAIQLFEREKVAALCGEQWFQFLRSTMKNREPIAENKYEAFTHTLYSKQRIKENEVEEFVEFAILWVKKHEVKNV